MVKSRLSGAACHLPSLLSIQRHQHHPWDLGVLECPGRKTDTQVTASQDPPWGPDKRHPQTEQINQMNSHTAQPLGRVGEFTYSSAMGWSQNSKGWNQISKNPLFQNIGGRGSDLHQILESPCSLVVLGTLSLPGRRKQ